MCAPSCAEECAAYDRDPLLYDTKLTASGERQASKLAARVERLHPPPQLLVASPLRRALRTADLAFADAALPRLVTPLCRERLYHSSDVGRAPGVVAAEFTAWKGFDQLQPVWWHTANGEGEQPDPLAHDPEPEDVFLQRCLRFRDWLSARPESCIAVVSHWGVIEALTCTEFSNCELRTYQLEELGVRAPRECLVPPG